MSDIDGAPVIATTERADTMVTFWLDGLLLGVDIRLVQEVLRDQDISPVPLAEPAVLGLINLRGRLVAAIDLRHRLGLTPRTDADETVHFVLRTEGEPVSLVVDREGDVIEVDFESAEPVPETVGLPMRTFLVEAHQRAGSILLVLDAGRAIAPPAHTREVARAGTGR
jgi:purine-binding chemotaxis protein CheW